MLARFHAIQSITTPGECHPARFDMSFSPQRQRPKPPYKGRIGQMSKLWQSFDLDDAIAYWRKETGRASHARRLIS